ncbi:MULTISPECIES: Mu transposase C-terminal domain-containing protein [unclassified Ruegeria]|uniref:Mu transposase C-terminal domain-containing protein n=1 Tax=unclassified Ruegeria TaxID=2625375 RepID=UPI0014920D15|nr:MULTISPECIES: Mu transposase C-terminal domain-containing protein [unclassified Ruegeria]NOD90506.1 DDE-type integrase/transposase/recombinase [Ruegeria sp. HKCCD4318]NOE16466.1 DDE-type integrase/transposase/recombinase [Ruegeria sp. HKCCD4318-2]NOG07356.1 DDE-type integrase/transposase/recombinase [Ruegeria sp. HKCCD4315]
MKQIVKRRHQRTIKYRGETYAVDGAIAGRDAYQISNSQVDPFEISGQEYRDHVHDGLVKEEGFDKRPRNVTAKDAREAQLRLRIVENALKLGEEGVHWAKRIPILQREFAEEPTFKIKGNRFPRQSTVQNWVKLYRRGGPDALLPKRSNSGNRMPRFDSVFHEIVLDLLEMQYTSSDRQNLTSLSSDAYIQYQLVCHENGIKPGCCGRKAVEAIVHTIPHFDVLKWQLGSNEARQHMRIAQKYYDITAPYDQIELDCTKADIMLVDDSGEVIGRPWICAAIDCATSWIVAFQVFLPDPSSEHVAKALKEMISYPEEDFFEQHEIVNRKKIAALPKVVVMDQGSENVGEPIDAFIEVAGVHGHWAQPRKPQEKPFIENLFGAVRNKVSQLPGATKSKAYPDRDRTKKAMDEARLTLRVFNSIMQRWRYDEYGRTPRRKVQDIFKRGETPSAAWDRLADEHIVPEPPSLDEHHAALMIQSESRTLWHYGIEFESMQYNSEDLARLYRRLGPRQRVEIRYAPLDAREILVVDPHTGELVRASNKAKDLAALSYRELRECRPPKPKHDGPIKTAAELHAEVEARRAYKQGPKTKMQKNRAAEIDKLRAAEMQNRSLRDPQLIAQIRSAVGPNKLAVTRSKNLPRVERKDAGPNN